MRTKGSCLLSSETELFWCNWAHCAAIAHTYRTSPPCPFHSGPTYPYRSPFHTEPSLRTSTFHRARHGGRNGEKAIFCLLHYNSAKRGFNVWKKLLEVVVFLLGVEVENREFLRGPVDDFSRKPWPFRRYPRSSSFFTLEVASSILSLGSRKAQNRLVSVSMFPMTRNFRDDPICRSRH